MNLQFQIIMGTKHLIYFIVLYTSFIDIYCSNLEIKDLNFSNYTTNGNETTAFRMSASDNTSIHETLPSSSTLSRIYLNNMMSTLLNKTYPGVPLLNESNAINSTRKNNGSTEDAKTSFLTDKTKPNMVVHQPLVLSNLSITALENNTNFKNNFSGLNAIKTLTAATNYTKQFPVTERDMTTSVTNHTVIPNKQLNQTVVEVRPYGIIAAVPSNITFSAATNIAGMNASAEIVGPPNTTEVLKVSPSLSPTTTVTTKTQTVATTTTEETTTTIDPRLDDESSRSEIYKMHNNGLMLLHAQRSRSGSEAKKSELIDSLPAASINYHVRKRTNESETTKIGDNEKRVASTFGKLPQLVQKRSAISKAPITSKRIKNFILPSSVPFIPENTKQCREFYSSNKRCKHKHKFWSMIQGEDNNGSSIKKRKLIPKRYKNNYEKREVFTVDKFSARSYQVIKNNVHRHKRLRRALNKLMDDVDEEQATLDQDSIPAIPPIQRLSDISEGVETLQDDDLNKLRLDHFSRLPTPNLSLFKAFPTIPNIKPINANAEFPENALRRDESSFDKLEIRHITPPPDIPNITDIPDLTDIPTLKSIPTVPNVKPKNLGQSRSYPIKDTIQTNEGLETRVSVK